MAKVYATWSPDDASASITLSNGNLTAVQGGTNGTFQTVRSTIGVSSGKWYWEYTAVVNGRMAGIALSTAGLTATFTGADANGWGYYGNGGQKYNNGTGTAYGASFVAADVIGVALDMDAGTVTFYKNNVSQGTAFTGLSGTMFAAMSNDTNNAGFTANFGATALTYSPPAGYNSGLYTTGVVKDSALNSSGGSFTFNNVAGNFVVAVATTNSATALSATYNGVSMTIVGTPQQFDTQSNWLQVFTLANAPTGSNTLAFTGANKVFNATAVSYSNVNTVGQPEATAQKAQASATSVTNSVTTIVNNDWVVACFGANSAPTSYTNALARAGNVFPYLADSNVPVAIGAYSQTATGSATPWAMIQIALAPLPTATTLPTPVVMRQAVNRASTY